MKAQVARNRRIHTERENRRTAKNTAYLLFGSFVSRFNPQTSEMQVSADPTSEAEISSPFSEFRYASGALSAGFKSLTPVS